MIAELMLVMALVTAHPVVYEGKINNRPAVVHYSKTHFYVVYVKKHAWGTYVLEVTQVDVKTFEEEQLYVSEEIKA